MSINFSGCVGCPYRNQNQLQKTKYFLQNGGPLSAEVNLRCCAKNKELLVFQAPGVDEWTNSSPISSTNPHSCAARMKNSFQRKNVNRSDFDITEAVQCFPGKNAKGRDVKPCACAISSCLQYLEQDIIKGQYSTIVCFGKIAQNSVSKAIKNILANCPNFVSPVINNAAHPSGIVSNVNLDNSY